MSTGRTEESFDRAHIVLQRAERFPAKKVVSATRSSGLSVAKFAADLSEKLPYLAHYEQLIGYFKDFFFSLRINMCYVFEIVNECGSSERREEAFCLQGCFEFFCQYCIKSLSVVSYFRLSFDLPQNWDQVLKLVTYLYASILIF